jgi:hypothetical protein
MRTDRPEADVAGAAAQAGVRCGGFRVLFEDGAPLLRLVPGERELREGLTAAVLQGLSQAPALLEKVLQLRPPLRPYDRAEITLGPDALAQGEALSVGPGCIRLVLGESTSLEDAGRIARHEALHLLLAASLRGGEKWSGPDLAFAEWIVRGIEGGLDAAIPRFRAPLPGIFDPLPASRLEVQYKLGADAGYFGEPLFSALQSAQSEQRKLWLVEAALGTHYLERAPDVALLPILLDDWLIDYEQYARAVGNAPSGAGNLWRMSEVGWSRDPITRLSVAAQALQCDDHCAFSGTSAALEPVVWKNRGKVRLPLMASPSGPRPAPLHGFRAVLRELEGAAPLVALVEQAAHGQILEARVLWPRILARLLAAGLPLPEGGAGPVVRLVDAPSAPWQEAADALRPLLHEWTPRLSSEDAAGSILLVYGAPLSAASLLQARQLAAQRPVRGALFTGLNGGDAYELLPDLPEPLDPRYREEIWIPGRLFARPEELPALVDEATKDGRLKTPLTHLLSITAIGLEECHYPRANRAARG